MVNKDIENTILTLFKNPSTLNRALKMMIDAYQRPLYWQIRRLVINHDDADDVLQNTFIKAWKGLEHFEGKSSLFTWLYRIAINESLVILRKKAKEKNIPLEEVSKYLADTLSSDPHFKGDYIQRKLHEAIQMLPQQQRLVFTIRYFDNLPYEQIAEILDTSVGALKVSYHNAVKKIEEYLLEQVT